jgi:hypothetical protein
MSRHVWIAIAVSLSISSACGSSSPSAPSSTLAGSALTGATVNAIDGLPLAGITIKIGSQSAVSDASGSFHVENLSAGTLDVLLSAPSVVERRTTIVTPADDLLHEALIPTAFDLNAFDQMFRGSGRLERWTSAPSLVVMTTVMNYANAFGDSGEYHATSEQLTAAETELMVSQLTDALALLTGNAFAAFESVKLEAAPSGAIVKTLRTGAIVVGRYKGLQGLANTIGFGGGIATDAGQMTLGAVYLDRDFDKTSDQRRLLRTHELGHALGYSHVTTRTSIMNPAIGPEPTAFDRQGAAIAFQRIPGNLSPDSDPAATPPRSTRGGIFSSARVF